jgi:hypothetical protein
MGDPNSGLMNDTTSTVADRQTLVTCRFLSSSVEDRPGQGTVFAWLGYYSPLARWRNVPC